MNTSKSKGLLVALLLCIALVTLLSITGLDLDGFQIPGVQSPHGIRLGLDLQGGLSITYVADIPAGTSNEDAVSGMDSAVEMLRQRLTARGFTEATLARQGDHAIHVEIPGVENPEDLIAVLGSTAELTFRDADGNLVLPGSAVASAKVDRQQNDQGVMETVVQLTFKEEFRPAFTEATKTAAAAGDGKNFIAIYLDEEVKSTPYVDAQYAAAGIDSESCIVTLGNLKENPNAAKEFADLINIGRLPFPLTANPDENPEASNEVIGPQLGADALETSLLAGLIGLILVALFMLLIYRLPGLVSVVALVSYMALVVLIMSIAQINLSLPGIAGCILGIGMAVDANVIIFERIKEELRSGKTIRSSINSGYHNALSSIIDSNITTLIAAVVLWWQGTGSIQGFAVTLFISVIVSMFTALLVTRWLFRALLGFEIKNTALFGVKERGASHA